MGGGQVTNGTGPFWWFWCFVCTVLTPFGRYRKQWRTAARRAAVSTSACRPYSRGKPTAPPVNGCTVPPTCSRWRLCTSSSCPTAPSDRPTLTSTCTVTSWAAGCTTSMTSTSILRKVTSCWLPCWRSAKEEASRGFWWRAPTCLRMVSALVTRDVWRHRVPIRGVSFFHVITLTSKTAACITCAPSWRHLLCAEMVSSLMTLRLWLVPFPLVTQPTDISLTMVTC